MPRASPSGRAVRRSGTTWWGTRSGSRAVRPRGHGISRACSKRASRGSRLDFQSDDSLDHPLQRLSGVRCHCGVASPLRASRRRRTGCPLETVHRAVKTLPPRQGRLAPADLPPDTLRETDDVMTRAQAEASRRCTLIVSSRGTLTNRCLARPNGPGQHLHRVSGLGRCSSTWDVSTSIEFRLRGIACRRRCVRRRASAGRLKPGGSHRGPGTNRARPLVANIRSQTPAIRLRGGWPGKCGSRVAIRARAGTFFVGVREASTISRAGTPANRRSARNRRSTPPGAAAGARTAARNLGATERAGLPAGQPPTPSRPAPRRRAVLGTRRSELGVGHGHLVDQSTEGLRTCPRDSCYAGACCFEASPAIKRIRSSLSRAIARGSCPRPCSSGDPPASASGEPRSRHRGGARTASSHVRPGHSRFDACGKCPSCGRIARGVHPDVVVLEPEDSGTIKIDQVRDVIDRANYRPFEGRRRVVIVDDADALVIQAQNALLKHSRSLRQRRCSCSCRRYRMHSSRR